MAKSVVLGVLLVGIGVLAGTFVGSRGFPHSASVPPAVPVVSARRGPGARPADGGKRHFSALERRLNLLAAEVEREAAERRHLQERLDEVAAEIAALRAPANLSDEAASPGPIAGSHAAPPAVGSLSPQVPEHAPVDDARTPTERALLAAGVDAATVEDIKRRRDELALAEIYLRDQATREGWLDTPRFREEMAEIARQRVSMRDEIGDEAYDRYLAALGHPNRVRVDEVFLDSPAAEAGLQAGDIVLRYGDARIFAPSDLVAETHGGTAGETVRLEVIRGGQRIAIDVPRGPLGVTVAASAAGSDEG
jgi:membrane-associated protease RseP (regulator of RpoE activity)